jgi:para-aminobenzoate synthetase component 1
LTQVRPLIHEASAVHTPESLVERLEGEGGVVLLRGAGAGEPYGRYSLVAARPFVTLRSRGERCEVLADTGERDCVIVNGDPWGVVDGWMRRCECGAETEYPFPLGGCFGYWGYGLKNFVEPRLARRAMDDLALPDAHLGFYDSLVVFDHGAGKAWVVSTGLAGDGSRQENRAREKLEWWRMMLESAPAPRKDLPPPASAPAEGSSEGEAAPVRAGVGGLSREAFVARVERARAYIRSGDIYQVNLSHRPAAPLQGSSWSLYRRLSAVSPAPFAAFLDCGSFQLVSSSPELFLRLSGRRVLTRPIKGTRPRSADPARDDRLACELRASPKEMAELVMITDLLRNDLGRVCEYGSVEVPELVRLERYAQVQHLVSTVAGRLRPEVSQLEALKSCFPGGSITGAPKIRAMEIIDELEPLARGPYTGALGYLGFNRESQFSIIIRTAICVRNTVYFPVGAGIVADSVPEAEYEETLAKAGGFFAAIQAAAGPLTEETGEIPAGAPPPARPGLETKACHLPCP